MSTAVTSLPRVLPALGAALLLTCLVLGCSSDDEGDCDVDTSYDPAIAPVAFVAAVDSPYYPLAPGAELVYTEGADSVRVVVLPDTKVILRVTCTVVHDESFEGGELIEDTYDWFAQDTQGNVWYFGEETKTLSGGTVVSTAGSWEAGVDGAKPGLIIPGNPSVGQVYRQEYYACVAEDMGKILDLNASATVPYGTFTGCLKTRDFTRLEPGVSENKYYAPGVGLVLTIDVGSGAREELVTVRGPGPH